MDNVVDNEYSRIIHDVGISVDTVDNVDFEYSLNSHCVYSKNFEYSCPFKIGRTMELWLSVVDYAVIKKVSVSTLRRRIKSKSIEAKIENGKYLLRVSPEESLNFKRESGFDPLKGSSENNESDEDRGGSTSVQELLQELKSAYSQIFSEKEAMITQLKSEIEILKHMNHFLEQQIMNTPDPSPNSGHNIYPDPDLI